MPDAAPSPEESKPIDEPPPKQAELKEEVTVKGGRRRGRRQVMKKKTVKDDEGYLGKIVHCLRIVTTANWLVLSDC